MRGDGGVLTDRYEKGMPEAVVEAELTAMVDDMMRGNRKVVVSSVQSLQSGKRRGSLAKVERLVKRSQSQGVFRVLALTIAAIIVLVVSLLCA
jgi:hypothetical protein